jgi:tRNA A37 threonylcarbamoyladenosine biosynthesis protein TsaE
LYSNSKRSSENSNHSAAHTKARVIARSAAAQLKTLNMIVICLEGCHGSGKTSLCKEFGARGYNVLDEGECAFDHI